MVEIISEKILQQKFYNTKIQNMKKSGEWDMIAFKLQKDDEELAKQIVNSQSESAEETEEKMEESVVKTDSSKQESQTENLLDTKNIFSLFKIK